MENPGLNAWGQVLLNEEKQQEGTESKCELSVSFRVQFFLLGHD